MDDKGEIISSYDVDENIALQIWTKGLSPRLVVFNKGKKSRKLIRLNWLEKLDRKLSIKGEKRGSSVEYALSDLLPALQKILSEYAVYTHFKPRLWKFAGLLEKVLHAPSIVSEKGELALLPEEKRNSLWIADITEGKKGEGVFRPFFPLTDKEKAVLAPEGIPFTENRRGVEDLFKTGAVRKLSAAEPSRWHRPLRILAAAMLLGFSYCDADGSDFSDLLWHKENPEEPFLFKMHDTRLLGLGRKYVGYVRHYEALEQIGVWSASDSDKELQEEGFVRKRRLPFPEGSIGDVGYSVTFFEHEDGRMALGCKPQAATSRHQGDRVYSFSNALYGNALVHDAFGGAADEYYTVSQLVSAKSFEAWSAAVAPYVASFAGLMG